MARHGVRKMNLAHEIESVLRTHGESDMKYKRFLEVWGIDSKRSKITPPSETYFIAVRKHWLKRQRPETAKPQKGATPLPTPGGGSATVAPDGGTRLIPFNKQAIEQALDGMKNVVAANSSAVSYLRSILGVIDELGGVDFVRSFIKVHETLASLEGESGGTNHE